MTLQGNGQPLFHEVRFAGQAKAEVVELHRKAAEQGRGHIFLDALRGIYHWLRNDPEQFGEPLYRLPALQLVVYHAVASDLIVDYAVHRERRLVFLKGIRRLR
jgi:hypothetical protein